MLGQHLLKGYMKCYVTFVFFNNRFIYPCIFSFEYKLHHILNSFNCQHIFSILLTDWLIDLLIDRWSLISRWKVSFDKRVSTARVTAQGGSDIQQHWGFQPDIL